MQRGGDRLNWADRPRAAVAIGLQPGRHGAVLGGTVGATEIVYTTPEIREATAFSVTAAYGRGSQTYSGVLDGRPLILTLTPSPCSDGMSDNEHAYPAALRVRGETRQGRADPR